VAVRNGAYILRTLHGWERTLYLPAAMNNYSAIHDPLQRNIVNARKLFENVRASDKEYARDYSGFINSAACVMQGFNRT